MVSYIIELRVLEGEKPKYVTGFSNALYCANTTQNKDDALTFPTFSKAARWGGSYLTSYHWKVVEHKVTDHCDLCGHPGALHYKEEKTWLCDDGVACLVRYHARKREELGGVVLTDPEDPF